MADFKVGETILKPSMGICKIRGIRRMNFDGIEKKCYVIAAGDASIMVPMDKAFELGLRYPINEEEVDNLLEKFKEVYELPEELPSVEVLAMKALMKKRKVEDLAHIIQNMYHRNKVEPMNSREEDCWVSATKLLAEEMAHAKHTTRAKMVNQIRGALAQSKKSAKMSLGE